MQRGQRGVVIAQPGLVSGSVLKDAAVYLVWMWCSGHSALRCCPGGPWGETLLLWFTSSVYQTNKTSPLRCLCGAACLAHRVDVSQFTDSSCRGKKKNIYVSCIHQAHFAFMAPLALKGLCFRFYLCGWTFAPGDVRGTENVWVFSH